jgi:hypothetical protein
MKSVKRLMSAAVLAVVAGVACSSDEPTNPFAPMGLELFLTPAVDTIFISGAIKPGDQIKLSLSATSFGLTVTPPKGVEWTVADASIATVDSTGTVRPVRLGSTTVTARVNSERATARVFVLNRLTTASQTLRSRGSYRIAGKISS